MWWQPFKACDKKLSMRQMWYYFKACSIQMVGSAVQIAIAGFVRWHIIKLLIKCWYQRTMCFVVFIVNSFVIASLPIALLLQHNVPLCSSNSTYPWAYAITCFVLACHSCGFSLLLWLPIALLWWLPINCFDGSTPFILSIYICI